LVTPAMLLIAMLFIVPVLRVLWLSVSEPSLGLQNYALLGSSDTIHRIAATTAWLCILTTALTVLLGYIIAYAMVHAGGREMRIMLFLIVLTFWLSILARSFAWVILLRTNGPINQLLLATGVINQPLNLVRNSFGVTVGMVHVMLPLAILPLFSALRGIDQRVIAAARGLGCGGIRAFLWVFLPLSLPGIMAATVLTFVFSLGFFVTPAILGGGRVIMIAEYIRTQFELTLRWGFAAMLATTLLIAVFAVLAIASRAIDLRKIAG
jgi:putative spermidine/putrescine transport system permease protein